MREERQNQWLRPYQKILRRNPVHEAAVSACMRHQNQSSSAALYLHAVAPALVDFVTWVIKTALADGKKRLYFLARDGYQMYLAADALCRKRNIALECRYLAVSRYAMRVPEYHLMGEQCLERICIGGIQITFEKIMKRAALTEEEAALAAKRLGFEGRSHQVLSYVEIQDLKLRLKEIPEFLEQIYAHSRQAYGSAMEYLRQEGLLEEVPYGVVDSGWVGTLQESMERLLSSAGYQRPVEGYYFGLYEIPSKQNTKKYHGFYFTPQNGIRRKVYFSNCLFEAIVSAPEGMTLGYEPIQAGAMGLANEGQAQPVRMIPIRDRKRNPNHERMNEYVRLLLFYVNEYEARKPDIRSLDEVCSRRMVFGLFKQFMGRPRRVEYEAYGELLFCDDVLEGGLSAVAARMSQREIFRQHFLFRALWMLGLRKGNPKESAWLEGSIAGNGKWTAIHFVHAAVYKYIIYMRKWIKRD